MTRGVDQYDLQRGSNPTLEKVPATRRPVGQAENNVNVKTRIAVVADRNVADRAQDFALFGDLDFLVSLLLDIEPADGGFLESTDSSQGCRSNSGFVREFRQCRKRLFARLNRSMSEAICTGTERSINTTSRNISAWVQGQFGH